MPTVNISPLTQEDLIDWHTIDPGSSLFDGATGIYKGREALIKATEARKNGDKEGFFDHLSIAAQKPLSALNSLTSIGVKIIEAGSYFHWFGTMRFVVPLSKAVSGLGIVLCISEIFLEAISLKRSKTFESNFIHTSAPTSNDPTKLLRWARKTEKVVQRLLEKNGNDPRVDEIQEKISALKAKIGKSETIQQQDVEEIAREILIQDLRTFGKKFSAALEDPAIKAKLYRRLGVKFVDNYAETLKAFSLEEDPSPETLKEAKKILDKMHIQLEKRQNAHKMGITGAAVLLLGLIIGLTLACPPLAIALILAGTLIGVGRFFYWTAYAESDGWENDLDVWAKSNITKFYEGVIEPLSQGFSTSMGPNLTVNFGQRPVAEVE